MKDFFVVNNIVVCIDDGFGSCQEKKCLVFLFFVMGCDFLLNCIFSSFVRVEI